MQKIIHAGNSCKWKSRYAGNCCIAFITHAAYLTTERVGNSKMQCYLGDLSALTCQPCPLGSFSCICQQWPVWLVDGSIGRPLCTLAVPHLPKSVMWNNTMVVQTGYSYFIIRSENVQKHAKTCISNFLDPIQKCLSSRSLQLEAIVGIVFSLRIWG